MFAVFAFVPFGHHQTENDAVPKRMRVGDFFLVEEHRADRTKWYTLAWGIFCIVVAMFTYNVGNSLIEAVNVLGSLFYGVILGVFLVAFFMKKIRNGNAVFWGAVLAELLVLTVFILTKVGVLKLGFLWLNPIGAFGVIGFTLMLNNIFRKKESQV